MDAFFSAAAKYDFRHQPMIVVAYVALFTSKNSKRHWLRTINQQISAIDSGIKSVRASVPSEVYRSITKVKSSTTRVVTAFC